jgi:hypothetical protein
MYGMRILAQGKDFEATLATGVPTEGRAISRALPTKTELCVKKCRFTAGRGAYGQHGVISEEERVGDNLPRSIPLNLFFINEDPHEFGNCECGMSLLEERVSRLRGVYR